MGIQFEKDYNLLLERITNELDIPASKYQQAIARYNDVACWLNEIKNPEIKGKLHIYPQGSFRLGTVVRPIFKGKEADYDIDLVCKIPINKNDTTPKAIKEIVGKRLEEDAHYSKMLDEEGKRCWTLEYPETDSIGFHMDILPSIQESSEIIRLIQQFVPFNLASKAIAITDLSEKQYSWETSNPDAYGEWFDEIKKPVFKKLAYEQKNRILSENVKFYNNVDEVPDQLVKTPLQRAIQILKRHRDLRFFNHQLEEDKPISIIITTLAAKLYEQEEDTYTALKRIIEKLDDYAQLQKTENISYFQQESYKIIERNIDGTWYIGNPVNPEENFAEYWHENGNRKATAFFSWVSWVKSDLLKALELSDIPTIGKSLKCYIGESVINNALGQFKNTEAIHSNIMVINNNRPEEILNPSKPWRADV